MDHTIQSNAREGAFWQVMSGREKKWAACEWTLGNLTNRAIMLATWGLASININILFVIFGVHWHTTHGSSSSSSSSSSSFTHHRAFYLRQRCNVYLAFVCLFVCLSVCLLAISRKTNCRILWKFCQRCIFGQLEVPVNFKSSNSCMAKQIAPTISGPVVTLCHYLLRPTAITL